MAAYPTPPTDPTLKSVIEATACTVATKGRDYEHVVRTREARNPVYGFLMPNALYNDFYEYKKAVNIRSISYGPPPGMPPPGMMPPPMQMPSGMPMGPPPGMPPPRMSMPPGSVPAFLPSGIPKGLPPGMPTGPPPPIPVLSQSDLKSLQAEMDKLKSQERESEVNIERQKEALESSRQARIDELYRSKSQQIIEGHIKNCGLSLADLQDLMKNIKDNKFVISWFVKHVSEERKLEVLFLYLHQQSRALSLDSETRLDIVYLAGHIAQLCHDGPSWRPYVHVVARHICTLFAFALESRIPHVKEKLERQLKKWRASNVFDDKTVLKLKNPTGILELIANIERGDRQVAVNSVTEADNRTMKQYTEQHDSFVKYANARLAMLEKQQSDALDAIDRLKPATEMNVYFKAPAGIMAQLIRTEDYQYKPINTKDILNAKLDLALTDRLKSQIQRFYTAMPDSSIDEDGWEIGGFTSLYEIKKRKRDELERTIKEKGMNPEDVFTNRYKSPSPDPDGRSPSPTSMRLSRLDRESPPQHASSAVVLDGSSRSTGFGFSYNNGVGGRSPQAQRKSRFSDR